MLHSRSEAIDPLNGQEQGRGNDSYWIPLPAPVLQDGVSFWLNTSLCVALYCPRRDQEDVKGR